MAGHEFGALYKPLWTARFGYMMRSHGAVPGGSRAEASRQSSLRATSAGFGLLKYAMDSGSKEAARGRKHAGVMRAIAGYDCGYFECCR